MLKGLTPKIPGKALKAEYVSTLDFNAALSKIMERSYYDVGAYLFVGVWRLEGG